MPGLAERDPLLLLCTMYIIVSCLGLGDNLTVKAQDQRSILRSIVHKSLVW